MINEEKLTTIINEAKTKGYEVYRNTEFEGNEGTIESISFETKEKIYNLHFIDTFEKKIIFSKIENADIEKIDESDDAEKVLSKLKSLL